MSPIIIKADPIRSDNLAIYSPSFALLIKFSAIRSLLTSIRIARNLKYNDDQITKGLKLITGWEWIVIIIGLIVLLLWGPSKIPELARGLGRAKAEFERASREYLSESTKSRGVRRSSDDSMIILIAKSLGINTEGKTREEIFQEIVANIKAIKEVKPDKLS